MTRKPQTSVDELIAHEFPPRGLIYLNHAAVAPWPKRATEAVVHFSEQCLGDLAWAYPQWLAVEGELRIRLARLIGAHSDDIALTKNTSEALSFVAHGFPWHTGDTVVLPAEEFPSNRIVWESLASRGIGTRRVTLVGLPDPEGALIQAFDRTTRLLSVSSVQYATGLRLDLARLGAACRQADVAFCVDGIQGLGILPHPVDEYGIDFLVADGHKWLLGPEGLALFYCRASWRERLTLHEFGWHMTDHPDDFDRLDWRPATSGRRFECGSPNMLGIHGLAASLSLIAELGPDLIENRLQERSAFLLESLGAQPDIVLKTDARPGRYAGIVTFAPTERSGWSTDTLFAHLKTQQVYCARRGGGIRLSPHFYTPMEELEKTLSLLKEVSCHE